jgi:hypothetical protein
MLTEQQSRKIAKAVGMRYRGTDWDDARGEAVPTRMLFAEKDARLVHCFDLIDSVQACLAYKQRQRSQPE